MAGENNGVDNKGLIVVLHSSTYSFNDAATGKLVEGINIKYTAGEPVNENGQQGIVLYDDRLPYSVRGQLLAVPGYYRPVEEFVAVKDKKTGKTSRTLRIVGLQYVAAAKMARHDPGLVSCRILRALRLGQSS